MSTNNDAIKMEPERNSVQGKRVLLIGSGADIDGRAMGDAIDANRAGFDLVARVNKGYGTPEDCGSRADLVFVRKRAWFALWFLRLKRWLIQQEQDTPGEMLRIVAFWDGVGCPPSYAADVAKELNLPKASTGLLAAKWLLDRGADVTVIGYGYKDGDFATAKTYAVTGAADNNPHYDWAAENEWLRSHVNLI